MNTMATHRLSVIDSHTGGEPTRIVLAGGPDLGHGPLPERVRLFRDQYDHFRSAVVQEPRGSDVVVGALLVEPVDPSCATGVIFFNNVDYLGMCGHGTIGLIVTLAHLGRITVGVHRIETPVGVVTAELHATGEVSVTNVMSFRRLHDVAVDVPGHGEVRGDVAWGGNWFYLVHNHGLALDTTRIPELTDLAWRIRRAINQAGVSEVDHVELFGPPTDPRAQSRSFVLCPGGRIRSIPVRNGHQRQIGLSGRRGQVGGE